LGRLLHQAGQSRPFHQDRQYYQHLSLPAMLLNRPIHGFYKFMLVVDHQPVPLHLLIQLLILLLVSLLLS
jgi:hypothetical protein